MIYGKVIKLLNSIIFVLLLNSCSKFYNYTKIENKKSDVRYFIPDKDTLLVVKSVSVLNRVGYGDPIRRLDKAEINDSINYFLRIVNDINSINKNSIKLDSSTLITNDSIYKSLLNIKEFRNGFDYKQLQAINFKDKKDGLYIVVTVAKKYVGSYGWSGSPTAYSIHIIYDFFEIKNGDINRYTTIVKRRSSNLKNWKPLQRDTRKVFEKLYKLKEK